MGMRKLLGLAVWSLVASPACLVDAVLGPSCDQEHRSDECASATSRWVCVGDEKERSWADLPCPPETTCREVAGEEGCHGADPGGACATNQGCLAPSVCAGGVCTALTTGQTGACSQATTTTLSADTWVEVVVVVGSEAGVMDNLVDPSGCVAPGGGEGIAILDLELPVSALDVSVMEMPAVLGSVALHLMRDCPDAAVATACLEGTEPVSLQLTDPSPTIVALTSNRPDEPTPIVLSVRQR
jgi:hypothetical protein